MDGHSSRRGYALWPASLPAGTKQPPTDAATFALACRLSFSGAAVQAKSACKGLKRNPCGVKGCIWVGSYERTDGVPVKGHCKSKPYSSVKSDAKEKFESKRLRE